MAARHPPCRALKPKEKDYKVTDRDGMYVHVTAKGAMSFRMDCQPMSWLRSTMQPSRPSRPTSGCFFTQPCAKPCIPNSPIAEVPRDWKCPGFAFGPLSYHRRPNRLIATLSQRRSAEVERNQSNHVAQFARFGACSGLARSCFR